MMKREFPDWEKLYQEEEVESMPWFRPTLDDDIAAALEEWKIKPGAVLDNGTGPGTQAIALAERGFQVTATDLSETAIVKARSRADKAGAKIDFRQDDILKSRLDGGFDLICDRGCFHVVSPEERPVYVETVHRLLREEGILLLKCFSRLETREEGPYRFSPEEIRTLFEGRFRILEIRESLFRGNRRPFPKALFSVMRRA
ncbi:MAG: class I SAM-dependent methyltransferase [Deltaproteobacteria bacterium]|nr:class I SAM-dependent methyltransferase [Deltaproteobacteria bacterium]